jgi:hypothetical protein
MSVGQVDLISGVIPATGIAILGPGNYFFLVSASAPLKVVGQRSGITETFNGVPAGLELARLSGFTQFQLIGTPGVTYSVLYGAQSFREDTSIINSQIATISGSVITVSGLGSANGPTDHADQVVGAGATLAAAAAANAARKSVSIGSLSSNAPATTNLRIRGSGLVVGGAELQPGTFVNIATQAALDVFNGDANPQTVWVQEYT